MTDVQEKTSMAIELNIFVDKDRKFDRIVEENCNCEYAERTLPIDGTIEKCFSITTNYIETLDIKDAYLCFKKLYDKNFDLVNYVLELSESIRFCIIVCVRDKISPKIYFNGEFMELINKLNANIDIDYYPE